MRNFPKDPCRDYSVSNAEMTIWADLNQAGEYPENNKEFCLQSKKVDFYFADINYVVELDGEQVHRNRKAKDEELTDLLKKRHGCKVRRISYKAPLSKKERKEIVALILDDLKGYRREHRV